jgi:hypothetical protein
MRRKAYASTRLSTIVIGSTLALGVLGAVAGRILGMRSAERVFIAAFLLALTGDQANRVREAGGAIRRAHWVRLAGYLLADLGFALQVAGMGRWGTLGLLAGAGVWAIGTTWLVRLPVTRSAGVR